MAARLPAFPRLVFTVIEPLSLICGSLPALFAPDWFIREQIAEPAHPSGSATSAVSAASIASASVTVSDHARLVAQQLGNTYGLLFLIGVAVLYTSTELRVVRNYLVALLIADVGHVGLTIWGLGLDQFWAVDGWNAMTWGNIGATSFLAFTRVAYLRGLFGPDKPAVASVQDKTK